MKSACIQHVRGCVHACLYFIVACVCAGTAIYDCVCKIICGKQKDKQIGQTWLLTEIQDVRDGCIDGDVGNGPQMG